MKYLVSIVLLLFILSSCSNKVELDDSQAETFNKFYGNAGQDQACEIRELANGDFLIFGTIETAAKSTELALIRTDRFGNEKWTKTFGRGNEDIGGSMDIAENGNIILVGTSTKVSPVNSGNVTDIIVVELDETGVLTTSSNYLPINPFYYDGGENEEGKSILYDKTNLGGYIVGGSSDGANNLSPDNSIGINNPKGNKDFMILRMYIENGSLDTNEVYVGFNGNDLLTKGIQLDSDRMDYVFTGQTSENAVASPCFIRIESGAESPAAIVDYDDLSGFSGASLGNSIIKIPNGLFISGTVSNINSTMFGWRLPVSDDLIEIGNSTQFEISKNGSVLSNASTFDFASGSYLIAGSTNTGTGGGFDHFLASIDPQDGSINWEQTYGGTGNEEALAITPTRDGGYAIAGFSGFEGNALINVIKTNNQGILNP